MVAELVRDLMPYKDSIVEGLERMASRQRERVQLSRHYIKDGQHHYEETMVPADSPELMGALAAESDEKSPTPEGIPIVDPKGEGGDAVAAEHRLFEMILDATKGTFYYIVVKCVHAEDLTLRVMSTFLISTVKGMIRKKLPEPVDIEHMTFTSTRSCWRTTARWSTTASTTSRGRTP